VALALLIFASDSVAISGRRQQRGRSLCGFTFHFAAMRLHPQRPL
jgi:hypothetical protein